MTSPGFVGRVAMTASLALVASVPLAVLGQSAAPGTSAPSSPGIASFQPHELVDEHQWLWGGLQWSAPTQGPDGQVRVVIPVGDSLIAVGSVQGKGPESAEAWSSAAAWRSTDGGATWERTLLDGEVGGDAQMGWVVATPAGLLAVGAAGPQCMAAGEGERCPRLRRDVWTTWTSVDGASWTRIPTPEVFSGADIVDVASGPNGLVAIGSRGFDHPRLWTSPDGLVWQARHLPRDMFRKAHFMDVGAVQGGWVIVGSSGGTPPTGMAIRDPNGSVGAAWTSVDGQTWTAAHVAGHGPQVELRRLYEASGRLVAVGTREGGQVATLWTSLDGRGWALAPKAAHGYYAAYPMGTDGRHIVGEQVGNEALSFAVSDDGVTWRTLTNVGATATMPRREVGDGGPTVDSAVVLPDGVLFLGWSGDGPVTWRTLVVPEPMLSAPSPPPS